MFLHPDVFHQADSRLGRCNPDQLWALIATEAVLDATHAFQLAHYGHIRFDIRRANQQVTAHVVKFQVGVGKPVADFEATMICVVNGAGHHSDVTIAIIGVRGHHLSPGYV